MHFETNIIYLYVFLLSLFVGDVFSGGDMQKLREAMEKKAREQGIDPNNLKPGESLMIPPELTDEEEGSRHMPDIHKCDGCTAVAYQFERAFQKAHKHVKKGHPLSLADVIDVADLVCDKRLKEYGLKNINGEKYLSGPGLPKENEPGIIEAGGKWDARLSTLCKELIEMYEEDGIYDFYRVKENNKLAVNLCTAYCSQDQLDAMKTSRKDEL